MDMETDTRLRVHPLERFAPREHLFDLNETVTVLREEDYPVLHGHRQIAIFKHGYATFLVYDFEQGGDFTAGVADGMVTIVVLGGALAVHTSERLYDMAPGMMIVLAPGIAYRIVARTPSQLLFTVHLETPAQDAGEDERLATRRPAAVGASPEAAMFERVPESTSCLPRAIMRWDDEGGAPRDVSARDRG
jgi:quercetin dioxygenase-like cupin family protein